MNFYETKMGRIFFEHQLPQLIQSIQRLTTSLDKPTQALTLPVEADPGFLSSLYYGSYEPGPFRQTAKGRELTRAVNAAHDELTAVLPEETRKKLMEYQDALTMCETADMQMAYESGFRTAVQMLMAGLSRPGSAQNDDAAYAADGKER